MNWSRTGLTDLFWCEGLVTTQQLLLSNLSWTHDFVVKIHLQLACGSILLFIRFDRWKWQDKLLLKISLHNIFFYFLIYFFIPIDIILFFALNWYYVIRIKFGFFKKFNFFILKFKILFFKLFWLILIIFPIITLYNLKAILKWKI
jgi:hypothetical protein